jgi:hypothetical protein
MKDLKVTLNKYSDDPMLTKMGSAEKMATLSCNNILLLSWSARK